MDSKLSLEKYGRIESASIITVLSLKTIELSQIAGQDSSCYCKLQVNDYKKLWSVFLKQRQKELQSNSEIRAKISELM